jgi:hypothetical protein
MADLSRETGALEVVDHLELSVTPVAGINSLVTSARQAFQLVEPWSQAKSV